LAGLAPRRRAAGVGVPAVAVNVRPCFSGGDDHDFLVHLYEPGKKATLCGKVVLGQGLGGGRRIITCLVCRAAKPKTLGGSAA
jgi:hypothetical protein